MTKAPPGFAQSERHSFAPALMELSALEARLDRPDYGEREVVAARARRAMRVRGMIVELEAMAVDLILEVTQHMERRFTFKDGSRIDFVGTDEKWVSVGAPPREEP